MRVASAVPGGVWGPTLADVHAETAKTDPPHTSKLQVWVPRVLWEGKAVSLADLCVSGDPVRRKGGAEPGRDMGMVAAGIEYRVLVVAHSPTGDMTVLYERQETLPKCQWPVRRSIRRFWSSDVALSALLVALILSVFVLRPLVDQGRAGAWSW